MTGVKIHQKIAMDEEVAQNSVMNVELVQNVVMDGKINEEHRDGCQN